MQAVADLAVPTTFYRMWVAHVLKYLKYSVNIQIHSAYTTRIKELKSVQ